MDIVLYILIFVVVVVVVVTFKHSHVTDFAYAAITDVIGGTGVAAAIDSLRCCFHTRCAVCSHCGCANNNSNKYGVVVVTNSSQDSSGGTNIDIKVT